MKLDPVILNTDEFLAYGPINMVLSLFFICINKTDVSAENEFHKRMVPGINTLQFRCVLIESDQGISLNSSLTESVLKENFHNYI